MSSITGINGLEPTLNIIKYSKKIAIANKESIICGWNLINKELKKNKTQFIPVDSEHFSLWYGLKNLKTKNIENIYLTASGGPFINISLNKFKSIKINQALKHPNWKMGKKISIDSATMINKVYEVIEARNIFNINYKKIKILIHPKSYVHAILKFDNGLTKIIAHDTTMKIPIFNTLYTNSDKKLKSKVINIDSLNNLNLNKVNLKRFPMVKLLNFLPSKQSLFETVIVSANDTLVELFLNKKIKFIDIQKKLFKIINKKKFLKFKKKYPKKIQDIVELNNYVRLKTLENSYINHHLYMNKLKVILLSFILNLIFLSYSFSEIVKKIQITGNKRISDETILMFSRINEDQNFNSSTLNKILKNLYDSNFFSDVSVKFKEGIISIKVEEAPLIKDIKISGIKAKKFKKLIRESLILKPRGSFNNFSLSEEKKIIQSKLKSAGYYFSKIDPFVELLDDNMVSIDYRIDLGEKSKIGKISFIGDKVYKDKKLRSILVSEEYKFWKFISGKKFLREELIELDKRLLKNFYLNKGYYNVEINTSFAKLIDKNKFELIFNINANKKIYFGDMKVVLPNDFNHKNYEDLKEIIR